MSSKLDKIIKFNYAIYNIDVNNIDISKRFFNDCFSITLKLESKKEIKHVHSSRYRQFIDLINVKKLASKVAYMVNDRGDDEVRRAALDFCHFLESEKLESYTFVVRGLIKVRKYRENGKIKTEKPIFLLKNCLYSKNLIKAMFELPTSSIPDLKTEIKTIYGLDISLSELYNLKEKYGDGHSFFAAKHGQTFKKQIDN